MLMQVEKATIRLKNQDKPIKEIAKTLGATIWQVLKKKECTRLLSNIKRPEKSQKTIKWLMKKNTFNTSHRAINTHEEVAISLL